jgi:hypothetical protein
MLFFYGAIFLLQWPLSACCLQGVPDRRVCYSAGLMTILSIRKVVLSLLLPE